MTTLGNKNIFTRLQTLKAKPQYILSPVNPAKNVHSVTFFFILFLHLETNCLLIITSTKITLEQVCVLHFFIQISLLFIQWEFFGKSSHTFLTQIMGVNQ
jgi:hypothetical protein